eukprot:tig00021462_g21594.t1
MDDIFSIFLSSRRKRARDEEPPPAQPRPAQAPRAPEQPAASRIVEQEQEPAAKRSIGDYLAARRSSSAPTPIASENAVVEAALEATSPRQPPGLASPVAGSQPAPGAGASSNIQRALAIAGPERALSAERRRAAAADVLREVLAPRAPGPLPLPLSERAGADGSHPAPAAAGNSSAPNSKPAKEKGAVSSGGGGWASSRPPDPPEGAAIASWSDDDDEEEDAEGSDEGPDPERVLAEIEEEIEAEIAAAGLGAPAPRGDGRFGSCARLGTVRAPSSGTKTLSEPGPRRRRRRGRRGSRWSRGPALGPARRPRPHPPLRGPLPHGPSEGGAAASAAAVADELLAGGAGARPTRTRTPRAPRDRSPAEARRAPLSERPQAAIAGSAAGSASGPASLPPLPLAPSSSAAPGTGTGPAAAARTPPSAERGAALLGRIAAALGQPLREARAPPAAPPRPVALVLLTLARCPSGPSGAPQAAAGPGPARAAAAAAADSPIVIDSDVEEGEEIEGGREPSGRCQGDREEEPRPWEPEPDGLVMFRVPPGGGAGDPDARGRSLADFLARNRPSRLTQAYAHWIYVHRMDARRGEGEPELRLKIQIAEAEFEAMCAAGAVAVEGLKGLAAFSGLRTGKWVIWAPTRYIDDNWERVAGAVARGELGPSAKVAPRPADGQTPRYHAHVICVYTPDLFDEAEVLRVREALRALGFQRKLVYKARPAPGPAPGP